MSAKDTYHDTVKTALIKEGWTITHDPLRLPWKNKSLQVDLAAERILAAEKGEQKMAVEVKSFLDPNAVNAIHSAAGQYVFYRAILTRLEPDRSLYLAVPLAAFEALFGVDCVGEVLLKDEKIQLIVYHPEKEEIVQWLIP